MSKEKSRNQISKTGTTIGDITAGDVKDTLLRISAQESSSQKNPSFEEKRKSKEGIIVPKEIMNLDPEDLVFYAGEQGYAEYFILHKDEIDDELVFTVQKGKRRPNGIFVETAREEIPATTFANWFYQKSLVFSTKKENLTLQEETERVIQNLENKKKYHLNNKDRNPEYPKTIAFMDQLIQERKDSIPVNNLEATKNIISEMQRGLNLQMPESAFAQDAIEHLDEMKNNKEANLPTTTETFEGEQALQKIAELFADPNFAFPPIATHGSEFRGKKGKELREEYPEEFQLTPDTDAQVALELLQEAIGMTEKNLDSEKGQEYFGRQLKKEKVPSVVTIVPKGQYSEGAINIDTGGKQGIVLEQKTDDKGNTVNTIWIDHHGTKKEVLTSATALMLKFVKKIPQLNFKYEDQEQKWHSVANFITDIDNITFATNPKFIREDYARTLYGLYREIPTDQLVKELKYGGAKKVYTEEELAKKGWDSFSKNLQYKVDISLGKNGKNGGVADLVKEMQDHQLALDTPELGKYLFENYRSYTPQNKPKNPLIFVGVKASGMDSHITLQPGGGFFMSSTKDLTPAYEKLISAIPEIKDIAVLVRGTMIAYDPRRIENPKIITEREIANALELHKKMEIKKPEARPVVKIQKHIPGQRLEDKPLPLHVQKFIKKAELDPKDVRFNTLNNKPVSAHFDPSVRLFSEQQRRFIDIVKEVAERLNVRPEKNEKLDAFLERLSKAA
jgi:hypothetical protein